MRFSDKRATEGCHKNRLKEVEGYIWDGEKVVDVYDRESNITYRKSWKVVSAYRDIFCCPASEDNATVPGLRRVGSDGVDSRSDKADYVIRIIVKLYFSQSAGK